MTAPPMTASERFARAAAAFARAHAEDPEQKAAAYHGRVAEWVERLAPRAPEALRLAARCQHLRRWQVPRTSFPEGVTGYKQWRAHLAQRHAEQAEDVLRQAGYDDATVATVRALLVKKGLRGKADPTSDVQVLEDAVCLTFLEQQLSDFAAKHPPEKIVDIIRKTWAKMGPAGRQAALGLLPGLHPETRRLVERAVEPT